MTDPLNHTDDWLDDILAKRDIYHYSPHDGENNRLAKAAIQQRHQAELDAAEGRGRVAVITAVKNWADTTELTYQQLMQDELEKLKQPNPQAGEGGEG